MGEDAFGLLFGLGFTVALLTLGYVGGTIAERRHYASIRQRERELVRLPALTFETLPAGWTVKRCGLVTGSVVISLDYFKRFAAGLKSLVGGPLRSYESLLDRARREAVLRLKEEAKRRGFHAVANVRLDTSSIASPRGDNKGIAGIEILASGTGLAVDELRAGPAGR
jgi:uncharacterized protein YbjQ (UPF0145 family)